MEIIGNNDRKLSVFTKYIVNSTVQNLIKKKLKMDTGIDISELTIMDNGETVIVRLSTDVEISKNDLLKLVTAD